jgi:hypothetical protein
LQEHCERAFPAPGVESVCDMLAFAQLYGAQILKARATVFIKANAAAVTVTEGWRDLLRNNSELVGALVTAVSGNAVL